MAPRHHPPAFHPTHRSPATLLAVGLGGAIGTLTRYCLDRGVPSPVGHFPTATFIINLSGSFLIGLLLPVALSVADRHPLTRPFFITGILGGWTTYSALATDSATLVKTGHTLLALGDLAGTVLGGLALVALGFYASPAHSYVRYRREAGR
jgi:CrcB protein